MEKPTDPNRPTRHPILWKDADFYDEASLDAELTRVFDICHGCRRCFNLCDSFPKLFDAIDDSPTGELDSVPKEAFKDVVDACTLCDICFVNKCPYVPPHEFNIDFPHLMLRAKAVEAKKRGVPFVKGQIAQVDRNGKIAAPLADFVNWAIREESTLPRILMEKVAGIHKKAVLPPFQKTTFMSEVKKNPLTVNENAPGFGEKVVLFATCMGNYHRPNLARAAHRILAHNGVFVEIAYPGCCGMPMLENGEIAKVAKSAENIAQNFLPWVDKGYTILALVPSCALMLKQEWPLLLPENKDVLAVSNATMDISEYLVKLFKEKGVVSTPSPLGESITLHLACHSRAQNMGNKGAELLRLIPDTKVEVIERCSGHGGTWGMMVDHFETAMKVGAPVFKKATEQGHAYIASECPLAAIHIKQGMEMHATEKALREGGGKHHGESEKSELAKSEIAQKITHAHPLEIFAHACGLMELEV